MHLTAFLLHLLYGTLCFFCEGATHIAINRRKPVAGLGLTITCTSERDINNTIIFLFNGVNKAACIRFSCGSAVPRYSLTQNKSQMTTTLTINPFVSKNDSGNWTCSQDEEVSAVLNLSEIATILTWKSMMYTPSLLFLPSRVTPNDTITVTVTTPCAAPAAVITWTYPQNVSGSPPSNTPSSPGSCPSGQVKTTTNLTLPGNTPSLYNKRISLTVTVEHDSFDPPNYIKSQTTNVIQFPVPVTKVTMTNINSDNQKVGQQASESLTLTCVTSASFPTSTVTWSGITSGTTPTVTEETTSGVLVKTTSSVTFTVSRNDDGNVIQCVASNINGQSSPQSDRAILEIWYSPDKPIITDPGSLCEGKSTSLTCSSSDPGNPPATYYWTKNTVSMATGSPYTFTPGRDDHQSQIRCEAGNNHTDRSGHSRPQADVRQLNVYYIPRITISPASDHTRKEGQSLSLDCSADSNPDNSTLSWTFNGTTLTGVRLEKTNLSRFDHGVYSCTGRVDTGSVCPGGFLQGQGNVSVIVNFAPDITFNPNDIREGEALTLKCEANGRPETYTFGRFTQYCGDTEVEKKTGTMNGSVYTWTTQTATYLDTGVYECNVNNNVTNRQNVLVQRKRVNVHVRASPKFTTDKSQRRGAEVGTAVTLSQSFYNSYMNYTSVNWALFNSLLNESSTVKLTNVTLKRNGIAVKVDGFTASVVIKDFQEEDIGTYTVTACNSIGCSSSNVSVTAAGPPLVPLDFKVTKTTQRSISLKWKPNFPGGDFTQVFILYYRLRGSQDWQTMEYEDNPGGYVYADVTGLQPSSVYEFKIQPRNTRENGNEGNFTNSLFGTTSSPPAPPSQVVAIAAGVGVAAAAVILVAIVVIILVIKRRKQHGSDAESKLALHETSYGAERGNPVMEDNVLYAGSGDIGGAASSESVEYAIVQKKSKAKGKKVEDKKQARSRKQKRGDVYENTIPGQFGAAAGASTYANAGFDDDENDEKQTNGRNEDGLLYVGIDFSNQKPSQEIHGAEESTDYAGIAFGKVGPPLPPDEEETDREKK